MALAKVIKENKSFAYQKFKELQKNKGVSEYQVSVGTGISTTVFTMEVMSCSHIGHKYYNRTAWIPSLSLMMKYTSIM